MTIQKPLNHRQLQFIRALQCIQEKRKAREAQQKEASSPESSENDV